MSGNLRARLARISDEVDRQATVVSYPPKPHPSPEEEEAQSALAWFAFQDILRIAPPADPEKMRREWREAAAQYGASSTDHSGTRHHEDDAGTDQALPSARSSPPYDRSRIEEYRAIDDAFSLRFKKWRESLS